MFRVQGEGLTNAEVAELEAVCRRVCAKAHQARTAGTGQGKLKWFGTQANSQEVMDGLRIMDEYLNQQCSQITFVRKQTGQIVDQVRAEATDYGQVIPNIAQTTAAFRKTPRHTSSGLRIFAMNEMIDAIRNNDEEEKLNYVFHEVSHKVLDTKDYKYGKVACERLAIQNPTTAVHNADNWGYYVAGV